MSLTKTGSNGKNIVAYRRKEKHIRIVLISDLNFQTSKGNIYIFVLYSDLYCSSANPSIVHECGAVNTAILSLCVLYRLKVQHNLKIQSRQTNVDFDEDLPFSPSLACIFPVISYLHCSLL